MKHLNRLAISGLLLFCAACSQGTAIEEKNLADINPSGFDGGYMSYFLPRGEITVDVDFTAETGLLTLPFGEPRIVPDFSEHHHVVFNHAGFTTDDATIEIDEKGLLKTVASTSKDETIELAQAVGSIISQAQAFETATSGNKTIAGTPNAGAKTSIVPGCGHNIKRSVVVNLTYEHEEKLQDLVWGEDCSIEIEINGYLTPLDKLQARVYPSPDEITGTASCDRVVCFRIAGGYRLTATATLIHKLDDKKEDTYKKGDKATMAEIPLSVSANREVLAPMLGQVGYVRFDRRAFVENSTTATFTSGMLTSIKSHNPSEIVGFLSLPVEILKSFTILVSI